MRRQVWLLWSIIIESELSMKRTLGATLKVLFQILGGPLQKRRSSRNSLWGDKSKKIFSRTVSLATKTSPWCNPSTKSSKWQWGRNWSLKSTSKSKVVTSGATLSTSEANLALDSANLFALRQIRPSKKSKRIAARILKCRKDWLKVRRGASKGR